MTKMRLGWSSQVEIKLAPLTLSDMVACIKRVRRSLKFWSGKHGGVQGYLNYISHFIK